MKYLQLIRWPNLLMIGATQYLFQYFFINYYVRLGALTQLQFALLVVATIAIAAAGYVINDIEDVTADTINKPNKVLIGKQIPITIANNLFIGFNILGMVLGFYLAYSVGQPNYAMFFVLPSGLLYLYATRLKAMVLLGNAVISLLIGLTILLVGIFSVLPLLVNNQAYLELSYYIFNRLLIYAGFAFAVNLLREIVKDAEDLDGDYNAGIKTIPIILGLKRTGFVVGIVTLLVALAVVLLLSTVLYATDALLYYILFAVLGPLLLTAIKAFTATKKSDFTLLKHLFKGIMLTGLASVFILYYFILKA